MPPPCRRGREGEEEEENDLLWSFSYVIFSSIPLFPPLTSSVLLSTMLSDTLNLFDLTLPRWWLWRILKTHGNIKLEICTRQKWFITSHTVRGIQNGTLLIVCTCVHKRRREARMGEPARPSTSKGAISQGYMSCRVYCNKLILSRTRYVLFFCNTQMIWLHLALNETYILSIFSLLLILLKWF
jgi:hypothetical protein